MEPITLRNLIIGAGRPKIVVPLTARTIPELVREAAALSESPAQMAEWRVDFFERPEDTSALLEAAAALRQALGELPLLATFRRLQEGGQGRVSLNRYAVVLETLALSGCADLIDIELSAGEDFLGREMDFCRSHGVKVLLSSHDFQTTPGMPAMLGKLGLMEALGADVVKLAVTPQTPMDLINLLDATLTFSRSAACPVVTMSMGPLGRLSRVSGEIFGSALTFAAVGSASAPGQLQADMAAELLELFSPEW